MRRSYFRLLEGLLFSLPLLFASCGNGDNALEEIINGGGSGGSGGESESVSKYLVWDDTQLKLVATDIPSDAKEVTASTEKLEGGTYIVKGDVTISRAEGLDVTADTKLILCDGAKLTVNGHIEDELGSNTLKISIYGQEKQTGKLIIDATDSHGLWAKDIEIHGGDIDVKAVTGGFSPNGIYTYNDLAIYGGTVKATGGDATTSIGGGCSILCGETEGNLTIKGDAVVKAYGGAEDAVTGGTGIWVNGTAGTKGEIEISGNADVYAEAGKDANAAVACFSDLTFSGKQLVTVSTGTGRGLRTFGDGSISISAGTVTVSAEEIAAIESKVDLNISKCTLSASVNDGVPVVYSDKNITISNDVTKVELTNSSVSGTAITDMPQHFIWFSPLTGSLTLGGTNVTAVWTGVASISGVTAATPLTYAEKTLTYQP